MAIQPGQTALASDFVAVSSGAPDAGKGVKLDIDGKLHGAFLKTLFSLIAGETLNAASGPIPVVVGLINNAETISQKTADAGQIKINDTANNRGPAAQSFTVPAGGMAVVQVKLSLKKSGSPPDNLVVAIQASSGGLPSGPNLASASIGGGSITTSFVEYTFNLSASLTAGAVYWIVCYRSGSQSGSEHFLWAYNSAGGSGLYPGGDLYSHYNGSWTSYGADSYFAILETSVSGRIYQAKANNSDRLNFIGFLPATTAKGLAGEVYTRGQVLGGFSGLTPERLYYLQDNGTIGLSAGANLVRVGVSLSATELLIL